MCSRVAWRRLSIGGLNSEVDIFKIKFYICHVIWNPQLGLESIRIAGAPRIWRLDSLQKQCSTGELLKYEKKEWNEKEWNMRNVYLVEIMN